MIYKTIQQSNLIDFDKEINYFLSIDWRLYGNPYAEKGYHYQAMIKEKI